MEARHGTEGEAPEMTEQASAASTVQTFTESQATDEAVLMLVRKLRRYDR